jgi:hypothetical protein
VEPIFTKNPPKKYLAKKRHSRKYTHPAWFPIVFFIGNDIPHNASIPIRAYDDIGRHDLPIRKEGASRVSLFVNGDGSHGCVVRYLCPGRCGEPVEQAVEVVILCLSVGTKISDVCNMRDSK